MDSLARSQRCARLERAKPLPAARGLEARIVSMNGVKGGPPVGGVPSTGACEGKCWAELGSAGGSLRDPTRTPASRRRGHVDTQRRACLVIGAMSRETRALRGARVTPPPAGGGTGRASFVWPRARMGARGTPLPAGRGTGLGWFRADPPPYGGASDPLPP